MASWIGTGGSNPGDVCTNGKLGIGSNNPPAKLTICEATNQAYILAGYDTSNQNLFNLQIQPNGRATFGLRDAPAGTENISLDANGNSFFNGGNVGIACTDPKVKLDVNDNSIRIRTSKTPVNSSDIGIQGQIAWDPNFLYVCVATNIWRRAALSGW